MVGGWLVDPGCLGEIPSTPASIPPPAVINIMWEVC